MPRMDPCTDCGRSHAPSPARRMETWQKDLCARGATEAGAAPDRWGFPACRQLIAFACIDALCSRRYAGSDPGAASVADVAAQLQNAV